MGRCEHNLCLQDLFGVSDYLSLVWLSMQAFWVGAKDSSCTPQCDQSVQGIHCRCAPAAWGNGGVPRCAAHPTQPHGRGQQPHSILGHEKVSSLKLCTLVALGCTVMQKSN